MRSRYEFYFDENHEFCCELDDGKMYNYYAKSEAIEILKLLDRLKYETADVSKTSISIKNSVTTVIIHDVENFLGGNYELYIPNIFKKIKTALKIQMKRKSDKCTRINMQKKDKKKPIITGTVMFLLVGTLALAHSKDKDDEIVLDNDNNYTTDDLKELSKKAINIDINVKVDNEDIDEFVNEPIYEESDSNEVYIGFNLTNDLEKKEYAYNKFNGIATEYANKWGISPNLVIALLTQESAGKEENLMQVEFDQWKDQVINAYNFKDGCYQSIILTDNPNDYKDQNIMTITRRELKNPKTNISVGCMLLRKSSEYMNYHILAGLQCYNLGPGNMEEVLFKTSKEENINVRDILNDQTNTDFINYTNIVGVGDPNYIPNVLQFLDNYGEAITFKHLSNGEVVEEEIKIYNEEARLTH